jgi:hypothetical protein
MGGGGGGGVARCGGRSPRSGSPRVGQSTGRRRPLVVATCSGPGVDVYTHPPAPGPERARGLARAACGTLAQRPEGSAAPPESGPAGDGGVEAGEPVGATPPLLRTGAAVDDGGAPCAEVGDTCPAGCDPEVAQSVQEGVGAEATPDVVEPVALGAAGALTDVLEALTGALGALVTAADGTGTFDV